MRIPIWSFLIPGNIEERLRSWDQVPKMEIIRILTPVVLSHGMPTYYSAMNLPVLKPLFSPICFCSIPGDDSIVST